MINDVTTDLDHPPEFIEIAKLNPDRDYSYPQKFAVEQKQKYPELKNLIMDRGLDQRDIVRAVNLLLDENGNWEVVYRSNTRFEAIARTAILGFKDDIVIDLISGPEGSVTLRMRSKSRVGRSDLGANYRRIKKFFSGLSSTLKAEKATQP